jgi:hypothetical protein
MIVIGMSAIVLNVVLLGSFLLNVAPAQIKNIIHIFLLSVIVLSVVALNVVLLGAILLNVAPAQIKTQYMSFC